jgi:hypothetical protein
MINNKNIYITFVESNISLLIAFLNISDKNFIIILESFISFLTSSSFLVVKGSLLIDNIDSEININSSPLFITSVNISSIIFKISTHCCKSICNYKKNYSKLKLKLKLDK